MCQEAHQPLLQEFKTPPFQVLEKPPRLQGQAMAKPEFKPTPIQLQSFFHFMDTILSLNGEKQNGKVKKYLLTGQSTHYKLLLNPICLNMASVYKGCFISYPIGSHWSMTLYYRKAFLSSQSLTVRWDMYMQNSLKPGCTL